ncbi:MAG: hypothetical protein A2487_02515 [Candidatus Raymondbacteria bacterium RifOxyC12_full_50_8]|uniref:Rhamnogalacturonase A/B/Epimerase-like pectate lyase domain-containing protein n=1 Tax=Candidatus Raymondbacteria bacterium RIFOXYD12_FULL_49_13 TaxID=1817890 RepID=A0A1F7FHU2_UNCRA|nr:MAG: hypothetical protein A2248_21055 [Candidatus Raymondbacteria bacterium RIFOXYA2_FULL_49_16]OGK06279.1 MAG: hypothetical protein A2519_08370 [Candidatus Raymondbacteria bacterium RIFOXYD12_FULL_49_13]OGK07734.1 MAG: hypothetical protein A2487_02515 [Candidatus Raymondbacteria bacterium RifOxyC12_full_50_8]OGP40611.1 MAG: hypothetical protein A2324_03125 [Candidatus Raymondbacteria bacterium RIFOXYB2_FULL_49_35]
MATEYFQKNGSTAPGVDLVTNQKVGIGYTNGDTINQELVVNGEAGIGYNDASQTAKLAVNGCVGIGTTDPQEALHVIGNVRGNSSGGALRIQTGNGYLDIGPQSTSWAHIYSDRSRFLFNKEVVVNTGKISSYDENLLIRADYNAAETANQLYLKTDGAVGIGTVSPGEKLEVDGNIKLTDPTNDRVWTTEKVFNVLDYGADPIGTTDSKRAIQLAIDAAASGNGGGTVYFPKGTYLVMGFTGSVTSVTSDTVFTDTAATFISGANASNVAIGDMVINYSNKCAGIITNVTATQITVGSLIGSVTTPYNNKFVAGNKYCIVGLKLKHGVCLKGELSSIHDAIPAVKIVGKTWSTGSTVHGGNEKTFTVLSVDCATEWPKVRMVDITVQRDATWNSDADYKDVGVDIYNYRVKHPGEGYGPAYYPSLERINVGDNINKLGFETGLRIAAWNGIAEQVNVFYCKRGIDLNMPGDSTNLVNVINPYVYGSSEIGIRMTGYSNRLLGGQISSNSDISGFTCIQVDNDGCQSGVPAMINYIDGISPECAAPDTIGIKLNANSRATKITGCWFNLAAPGKTDIDIDAASVGNNIFGNFTWGSYGGVSTGWANLDWKTAGGLSITSEGTFAGAGQIDGSGTTINAKYQYIGGSGKVHTVGSVQRVTSDGYNEFANIDVGSKIKANGLERRVTNWIDANTIDVDSNVNWENSGTGYDWTYSPTVFTTGSSTTVETTHGGFAAIWPGMRIRANSNPRVVLTKSWDHNTITVATPVDWPTGSDFTMDFQYPIFKNIPLFSLISASNGESRNIIAIPDDFSATANSSVSAWTAGYWFSITKNDAMLNINGGSSNKMAIRANIYAKDFYDLPGIHFNRWTGNTSPDTFDNARIGMSGTGPYDLTFGTAAAQTDKDIVTEKMRITSSGNVGIGITNPSQKLHLRGQMLIDDDSPAGWYSGSEAVLNLGDTSSFIKNAYGSTYSYGLRLSTNNYLTLETTPASNKPIVIIPGGTGCVGVGTTSPGQKLDVAGNIKTSGQIMLGNVRFGTAASNPTTDEWKYKGSLYINTSDGKLRINIADDSSTPNWVVVGTQS